MLHSWYGNQPVLLLGIARCSFPRGLFEQLPLTYIYLKPCAYFAAFSICQPNLPSCHCNPSQSSQIFRQLFANKTRCCPGVDCGIDFPPIVTAANNCVSSSISLPLDWKGNSVRPLLTFFAAGIAGHFPLSGSVPCI